MSRAQSVVTLLALAGMWGATLPGCARRTGVTQPPVEEVAQPEAAAVPTATDSPTTEPSEDEPAASQSAGTAESSEPAFVVDMSGQWHWEVRWVKPEGEWLAITATPGTGSGAMEVFPYSEQVCKGYATFEPGTHSVSAILVSEDDSTTEPRSLSAEELAAICEVKAVAGPGAYRP